MRSNFSAAVNEAIEDKGTELSPEDKEKALSKIKDIEEELDDEINRLFDDIRNQLKSASYDHKLEIHDSYYLNKVMCQSIESLAKSFS